ncbi:head GIN domain-containing protein [Psychroserpens mesophilus]|uniref:head GIN domain-containing protein n=1 Tax=Psychroserpens mesophilus TaxID=325473 RepID=UPI003D659C54
MRTFLAITLLFLSTLLSAQNPKEKGVGDFSEVKVFDLIEVNLIKSDVDKVEITGDDIEDVEVLNKNGKLKIRMKLDKIFNGDKTFVAVYYTKLNVIDGNEGAFISSNELITQDYIELRAQEGARLKIGLDVDKVDIRAVTGGIIETRGKAVSQDITLNTGGIYEGRSFETKNTSVNIKAAGEADVYASNEVTAKVLAGGDVFIYGNPENIQEKTTLGGRVKRMN